MQLRKMQNPVLVVPFKRKAFKYVLRLGSMLRLKMCNFPNAVGQKQQRKNRYQQCQLYTSGNKMKITSSFITSRIVLFAGPRIVGQLPRDSEDIVCWNAWSKTTYPRFPHSS